MKVRHITNWLGLRRTLWSASVLLGVLQGCAFSDEHVVLSYEPVVPVAAGGGAVVTVNQFVDERPNPTVVGEIRNLNMVRTADRVVDESVGAWVADAFTQELARAGLRPQGPGSNAERSVTGSIEKFFVSINADFVLTCTLRVRVVAQKGASTALDRLYVGKGDAVARWGTKTESAEAIREALQSITRVAVPEIVEAIR